MVFVDELIRCVQTLKSLYWDDNGTTPISWASLVRALKENFTLVHAQVRKDVLFLDVVTESFFVVFFCKSVSCSGHYRVCSSRKARREAASASGNSDGRLVQDSESKSIWWRT
jgi:hypothetical protein